MRFAICVAAPSCVHGAATDHAGLAPAPGAGAACRARSIAAGCRSSISSSRPRSTSAWRMRWSSAGGCHAAGERSPTGAVAGSRDAQRCARPPPPPPSKPPSTLAVSNQRSSRGSHGSGSGSSGGSRHSCRGHQRPRHVNGRSRCTSLPVPVITCNRGDMARHSASASTSSHVCRRSAAIISASFMRWSSRVELLRVCHERRLGALALWPPPLYLDPILDCTRYSASSQDVRVDNVCSRWSRQSSTRTRSLKRCSSS